MSRARFLVGSAAPLPIPREKIKHRAGVYKIPVSLWANVAPIAAPKEVFRALDEACPDRIAVDVPRRFQQVRVVKYRNAAVTAAK